MFQEVFATRNSLTLTIARLILGIVFFAHGAQKVLGWFGGHGYTATMQSFTQGMHIPVVFAFLAIIAEFFGGIGLIVGFLSRIAVIGIGTIMLVVIFMEHQHNGFFMNWSGAQKGEGFEYHLLALALCLIILVQGSGALSIDRVISRDKR